VEALEPRYLGATLGTPAGPEVHIGASRRSPRSPGAAGRSERASSRRPGRSTSRGQFPCGSMRKNDRRAVMERSLSTPSRGNGSFNDWANVCREKVKLALAPRIWMPKASKRL
jgi:hypothetical protein